MKRCCQRPTKYKNYRQQWMYLPVLLALCPLPSERAKPSSPNTTEEALNERQPAVRMDGWFVAAARSAARCWCLIQLFWIDDANVPGLLLYTRYQYIYIYTWCIIYLVYIMLVIYTYIMLIISMYKPGTCIPFCLCL